MSYLLKITTKNNKLIAIINMMNFCEIDSKWQDIWSKQNIFKAKENKDKQKYYVLEMFPYPSGKIHVGHLRNYSIGDVVARFYRANNYNVLYPMGWDAFGLPAENAAIQNNIHPRDWTLSNIEKMREQIKSIGCSYDWSREINTCMPEYYKHEQAFFLKLVESGIAYQKESIVNWDPVDQTVLANEQVVEGKGWRSGALIERRLLNQWFLKITNYSEELLDELNNLSGWPESVRIMQENWIGKSVGANIKFKIENTSEFIDVYSTRPDTLFGASFIGVSYDHDYILKNIHHSEELKNFIEDCNNRGTSVIEIEKAEKKGFNTGLKAVHPFDSSILIPIYLTNFVLKDYGTGAIFGCPAHDERDHQFALKYGLDIIQVVKPILDSADVDIKIKPYTEEGIAINSSFLNNLTSSEAKNKAITKLEELQLGQKKVNYRLKDWGISRQRYWGCPIPIIYCSSCGLVPVPASELPVELPYDVVFDGQGNPLDKHPTWKHTNCPKCSNPAIRETDTFDTFFESSWYFARYCDNQASEMTNKSSCDYWLSVDQYIGGIEHAVLHLLYARFFTKVMHEEGLLSVKEPFKNLLTQGMVLHTTFKNSDGEFVYPENVEKTDEGLIEKFSNKFVTQGKLEKMSKSKKNVIDLESMLNKFGADTTRLFILSDSPPERDLEWSNAGVEGCGKFLVRLYTSAKNLKSLNINDKDDKKLLCQIHSTIKFVTNDIRVFHFNKAIARIRELYNTISDQINSASITNTAVLGFETIVRLLNPFAPHITEEIWQGMGYNKILALNDWPLYDEALTISDEVEIAVQINGKLRATFSSSKSSTKEQLEEIALSNINVTKFLINQTVKKIIIIPGKIVNIVTDVK